MKNLILPAVALLATTGASAQTIAENPQAPYENYIQVSGKAEREVTPDEIYVRIIIDEENLKSKQTLEKAEQQMIASLRNLGIDTDRDLKIDNMSSNYKNYLLRKNNPKSSASYTLKVTSAFQLSGVYQTMESIGISNLSINKLGYSRQKELQQELRIEAMRNAREVADQLASAIGQTAGRAIYIVDYNNDGVYPVSDNQIMYARAASAEAYQTELDFKDIKFNYTVTVKFALE